jgi:arabinofuranosyltransferase
VGSIDMALITVIMMVAAIVGVPTVAFYGCGIALLSGASLVAAVDGTTGAAVGLAEAAFMLILGGAVVDFARATASRQLATARGAVKDRAHEVATAFNSATATAAAAATTAAVAATAGGGSATSLTSVQAAVSGSKLLVLVPALGALFVAASVSVGSWVLAGLLCSAWLIASGALRVPVLSTLAVGATASLGSMFGVDIDSPALWQPALTVALAATGICLLQRTTSAFLESPSFQTRLSPMVNVATVLATPRPKPEAKIPHSPRNWSRADAVGIALAMAVAAVVAVKLLSVASTPAEDAAMLMRYAENFANGHGLTWNPGESPVDGATDFGFAVLVGSLVALGFSSDTSVIVLDLVAHFALVALVFFTARRFHGSSTTTATIAALVIAAGPGLIYSQARFGTPVFGLAAGATWAAAMAVVSDPSAKRARAFGICGLIAGLIRPEGALLFLLIAAALLVMIPTASRKLVAKNAALAFIPAGLAYFAFHWAYYGYPLPNPFYKKGGGELHVDGLEESVRMLTTWLPWITAVYVVATVALWRQWRKSLFYTLPVVGFTLVWILLSSEMNYAFRFQYPTFVIMALTWPVLWMSLNRTTTIPFLRAGLAVMAVVAIGNTSLKYVDQYDTLNVTKTAGSDGREAVALALSPFKQNRTLATTEAGLLPLYSGWKAIDLWGLNDKHIAHNGLDETYLNDVSPDVILVHYFPSSPLVGWNDMTTTTLSWAKANGYITAAAFGPPTDSSDLHLYLVKRELGALDLMNAIRSVKNYPMYGAPAVNYALAPTYSLPG